MLVFAAWTLCTHGAVALQGSLIQLERAFALVLLLGVPPLVWILGREARGARHPGERMARAEVSGVSVRFLAAALVLVLAYLGTRSYVLFWTGAVLLLAWGARRDGGPGADESCTRTDAPGDARKALLLVALATLLPLFLARPNPDDSLYLGMATSAFDAPDRAVHSLDVLHGHPDVGLLAAVYRLHAFELAIASVARLVGLDPLTVAHVLFPPIFGALAGCVLLRLTRLVCGVRWASTSLATILAMVLLTDASRSVGHFTFVRLFQGKGVLVTVFLPLVATQAILHARARGRARWTWMLLALTQIGALGATSTALSVVPLVSAASLLGSVGPGHWKRVALGFGASSYLIAAGAWARVALADRPAGPFRLDDPVPSWNEVLEHTLGTGPALALGLLALLVSWTVLPALGRRWLRTSALAFLLIPANPFLAGVLGSWVSGGTTLWRVTWVFPLPLAAGILVAWPLVEATRVGRPRMAWSLAGLAGVLLLGAGARGLAGTRLAAPGLRVPEQEFALACALVRATPVGSVLAPESVATWIPTIAGHARAAVTRPLYLETLAARDPDGPAGEDLLLCDLVNGRPERLAALGSMRVRNVLERSLARLDVHTVALAKENRLAKRIEPCLREAGFEPLARSPDGWAVYARAPLAATAP